MRKSGLENCFKKLPTNDGHEITILLQLLDTAPSLLCVSGHKYRILCAAQYLKHINNPLVSYNHKEQSGSSGISAELSVGLSALDVVPCLFVC